jgi:5-methylcytosine-specific restriction endonuclease McrA
VQWAARMAANNKRWREKHAAACLARVRAWQAANPDKVRLSNIRHSARRRSAPGNGLKLSEWRAVLTVFGHACAYCLRTGVKLEQEHVIALALGGAHEEVNIVPACRACNTRKGARPVWVMAAS